MLLVFLFLLVAGLVGAGAVASGAAVVVAGLLVLAALIWVVQESDLKGLLENLKSLQVGPHGVSFELYKRAKEVASQLAPEERKLTGTGKKRKKAATPKSVTELRLRMEEKLAYIAKDLLEPHPTFVTVGSLRHDGFLDHKTAAVADDILTLRDDDLRSLPPVERQQILEVLDEVVRSIRARVLHGWVGKTLDGAHDWRWEHVDRGAGRLPDFRAVHAEKVVLLASAFATSESSPIFERATDRLRPEDDAPDEAAVRVIVVPRKVRESMLTRDGDPRVVGAQDLRDLLDEIAKSPGTDRE